MTSATTAAPRGYPPSVRQPPWAGTTIEEFVAAVLATAARLLAGALSARLVRAFPVMSSPARF